MQYAIDPMNDRERARRRILRRMLLLGGWYLSAPLSALADEHDSPRSSPGSAVLSAAQRDLIIALGDTILPETDTPGAVTARVHDFIEHILAAWFSVGERATFLSGLDMFEATCITSMGRSFVGMPEKARLEYIEPLDRDAVAARARNVEPLPFFATMKQLTLIGYYTSEVGSAAIGYAGPVAARTGRDGPISSAIWN